MKYLIVIADDFLRRNSSMTHQRERGVMLTQAIKDILSTQCVDDFKHAYFLTPGVGSA